MFIGKEATSTQNTRPVGSTDTMKTRLPGFRCSPLIMMTGGGLLLIGAAALAADTVLTWTDAVREATARNGELKSAQDSFEAAQARRKAAASGYYPQVSADVGYSDSSGTATTGTTTSGTS